MVAPEGSTMTTLTRSALGRFRNDFRGRLISPGDEGYDAARAVWNAAVDRRPALIARAGGAGDVVTAVRFAREHSLPVSIRGGGHSAAGFAVADGALMLDLSGMRSVRVDPAARTAVAEPGTLWSQLDAATGEFGLATTGGVVGLHRHRRADARRRHRLAGPAGRADVRQPARRGGRRGGREGSEG
jgi:FAD binding domain